AALLLADAIAQENRPIRLDRVPVNSPLIPALKAQMKRRGWVSERPAAPFPTITLDGRWTAPETRFNTGRQSDFRRARRRAEQFGHVSFSVHTPSVDEFDALFDEAIGVEMRSWKKETGSALAISRANGDFFRRYFRSACDHQAVRIAFMRINGRPVAMQLAMLSSDRFWLFKIGHDESFGRCSPGTLLMLHTLGYAASIGLRGYEYLGSTERWIADFWTQEQHECVRLRTYPFNARGAGALLADGAQWLWRRMRGAAG
ncbi:MAG: GNAT family N-acetyltransferase, partial [Sphingopyxis sp.]